MAFDGRRHYVRAETRAGVVRKLGELRRRYERRELVVPSRITVGEHLDDWLKAASPDLRPKTVADYETSLRLHLKPAFGRERLQTLTAATMALQFAEWKAEGRLSGKSLRNLHSTLHRALVFAVRWGRLGRHPMEGLEAPRAHTSPPTLWTNAESSAFVAGLPIGTWEGALFAVLVGSGCRIGEALGLRWEDWDKGTSALSISRTRTRLRGEFIEGMPKTRAGTRVVRLPDFVASALLKWRVEQAQMRLRTGAEWQGDDRIVTLESGDSPKHRKAYNAFHKLCDDGGVRRIRIHDLRHLHASLALGAGVTLVDVSRRLGHANVGVTAAIYAHALKDDDSHVSRAVERALGV